jgi:hypothetical protein
MTQPVSATTALLQNVAAISAHFHMHGDIGEFRDLFPDAPYDLCIEMALALSAWEKEHGGAHCAYDDNDLDWITVIESYVDTVIALMIDTEEDANVLYVLRDLPALKIKEAAP